MEVTMRSALMLLSASVRSGTPQGDLSSQLQVAQVWRGPVCEYLRTMTFCSCRSRRDIDKISVFAMMRNAIHTRRSLIYLPTYFKFFKTRYLLITNWYNKYLPVISLRSNNHRVTKLVHSEYKLSHIHYRFFF